jgi:NOL1/NOP2/fmu family ribosome biogenesis protein
MQREKEQAIRYLQKKDMHNLPHPSGLVLLQYAGLSLGWAKFLHTRVNNYYPTEWRILND